MKPYILQKQNDFTCNIITYLNAYIHKHNKSAIRYGGKVYKDFILKKCDGFIDTFGCLNYRALTPVLELTGVSTKYFKGKPQDLKKWIILNLEKGNLIDFCSYIRGFHSFLIAQYDSELDTFMCVNAHIYNNYSTVEWLPFPLIIKNNYTGKKHSNKDFYRGEKICTKIIHTEQTKAIIFKNK